jgi:hypothetical protein
MSAIRQSLAVALLFLGLAPPAGAQVPSLIGTGGDYVKKTTTIEIKGQLTVLDAINLQMPTGVSAYVTANGKEFWLDLSGNKALAAQAAKLNNKRVLLTGTVEARRALRGEMEVVAVASLTAAGSE